MVDALGSRELRGALARSLPASRPGLTGPRPLSQRHPPPFLRLPRHSFTAGRRVAGWAQSHGASEGCSATSSRRSRPAPGLDLGNSPGTRSLRGRSTSSDRTPAPRRRIPAARGSGVYLRVCPRPSPRWGRLRPRTGWSLLGAPPWGPLDSAFLFFSFFSSLFSSLPPSFPFFLPPSFPPPPLLFFPQAASYRGGTFDRYSWTHTVQIQESTLDVEKSRYPGCILDY